MRPLACYTADLAIIKLQTMKRFLQETKTRFKNKLKHPNCTFFEYIRKNCGGGQVKCYSTE